jgi:hypothetical protein
LKLKAIQLEITRGVAISSESREKVSNKRKWPLSITEWQLAAQNSRGRSLVHRVIQRRAEFEEKFMVIGQGENWLLRSLNILFYLLYYCFCTFPSSRQTLVPIELYVWTFTTKSKDQRISCMSLEKARYVLIINHRHNIKQEITP